MATFTFGRDIDIHWNGYDIQGPAGTVFSIPDQLYEEFDGDIAPVEPTLVWVDTNEFQTLQDSVVTSTIVGSAFITTASLTSGTQISIVSQTAADGHVLTADGAGGVAFEAAPGGAGALSAVIGTSPMSVLTSSGTATVSIDQSAITGAAAATNAQVVRFLVKNTTGTTIPKGSAVYVSGATGDNALISLASATSEVSSSKTLGITAEAIDTDAFGYVIEAGYLTDIDTSATTAGAAVWLGNTPGSLVFVSPPAEPSHAVYLGVVVRVQSNNGSILVKVQNGYELDELHDVFVGGVSTALPLVYSSTSSGWVAQALTSVGIADNAVVAAKIAASAVGSAAIATGSINSTHIGANAVVAGDIAANAVTSGNIAAGAVGSAALADNAVVSSKINAAAVGITKIDSGSATSGQVLTANGSSGVSFTTLASGGASLSSYSATVNNTISNLSSYLNSVNSKIQTQMAVAYDPNNHEIYVSGSTSSTTDIGASTMVYKINAANGSVLASASIAMSASTTNREGVVSIAFGSSKLCLLTNSSVNTVAPTSRWLILNSSLSTLATGNIHSAAQTARNQSVVMSAYSRPSVRYDKNANHFVIHHVSATSGTIYDNLYRLVNASTYTTGYYAFPQTISIGASTVTVATSYTSESDGNLSNLVYVPSLSRWVAWHSYATAGAPNTPNVQVISFSQSTTTTAVLSIAGRQIGMSTNTVSMTNHDGGKALLLDDAGTTLYGASSAQAIKIYISDISANINTNSSAGVTIRNGSFGVAGDSSGKTNCYLHYAKNGSEEWLAYPHDVTSNVIGIKAGAIWSDVDSALIQEDPSKNYYRYTNAVSTNTTTDKIHIKDTAALWTDAVNTIFDIGVNAGTTYVVAGAYNTTSTGQFTVRVAKLADYSKGIFQFHSTSDPLTSIQQASYTNSDASTKVESYYPTIGLNGTQLENSVLTGTYWNPVYGSNTAVTTYIMEPGSSMTYYVGSAVTTSLLDTTNTTTVKVFKTR